MEIKVGKYKFDLSNPDKILFPEEKISKLEFVQYYREVSEYMLRHVRDRAITMHRYPDGIDGDDFYQKQMSDYFPDWIDSIKLKKKEGGATEYVVCNSAACLAYLAGQACITPHIWLSKVDNPENPDRLIIDLDPPEGDFDIVRRAAQSLHSLIAEQIGVSVYIMTTGSRGLHLVIPLDGKSEFDEVRAVAQDLAKAAAIRDSENLTTEIRKDKRKGRLFLDTARNAYAQTAVAPYAVRALAGAPIATPIDWAELSDSNLNAQTFGIKNIARRLGQKGDPWAGINRHAVSVKTIAKGVTRVMEKHDTHE